MPTTISLSHVACVGLMVFTATGIRISTYMTIPILIGAILTDAMVCTGHGMVRGIRRGMTHGMDIMDIGTCHTCTMAIARQGHATIQHSPTIITHTIGQATATIPISIRAKFLTAEEIRDSDNVGI